MTAMAQAILFEKVRSLFSRSTAGIPIANKKKYRLSNEELAQTRNLTVLFSSVFSYFKTKIPEEDAVKWETAFLTGRIVDDDFMALLEAKPSKVALSMLKSKKVEAQRMEEEKQSMILMEVSQQKQAVTEAEWSWFQSALRQDQAMLSRVSQVPMKVKSALHAKAVHQRKQQAEAGQKATQGYQDISGIFQSSLILSSEAPFARRPTLGSSASAKWTFSKRRLFECGRQLCLGDVRRLRVASEAADSKISVEEVGLLAWADFNVPHARGKDAQQSLCKGMAMVNELSPELAASVLILPDLPKSSSMRGLCDEERQIFEELFALQQSCENRFVEVYGRENKRADQKSNSKRFGSGRIITSSAKLDTNKWLESELAVFGRVLGNNEGCEGAPIAILPRTSALLIPEPASPDALQKDLLDSI